MYDCPAHWSFCLFSWPFCTSGINNFDIDKLVAVQIVSASPYPIAFSSQTNRMYFVTKLGRPKDFPCGQLPGIKYFRVGAEGNCTNTNCNGILPPGSTVRYHNTIAIYIKDAFVIVSLESNRLLTAKNV